MRVKLLLVGAGAILLFAMEVSYSLALRKYDANPAASPFFKGPISSIWRALV